MTLPPKRVLIVDDSRAMRGWLRMVLSSDPRLQVVGEAADAVQARDFLKAQAADVLTLDIEMPGMSGLDFLTRLMRARPMPVMMMSSLTSAGSDAAIQALSRGAVDCMVKPTNGHGAELTRDICERIYQAACTRPASIQTALPEQAPTQAAVNHNIVTRHHPGRRNSIFLIGASTGGVAALEAVLPALSPDGPPVVIVQHMPGNFLISFADRLNRNLVQNVSLARENIPLSRGEIVLAPSEGQHTEIIRRNGEWMCKFVAIDPPALHCPAVDVLFKSAVHDASLVSAALLTGLGRDGAEGLKALAEAGAATFGQDEETCVVYGMPRAAKALGAVQKELPLDRIGHALSESEGKTSAKRMIDTTGTPQ